MRRTNGLKAAAEIVLHLLTLTVLVPIYFVLVNSFKSTSEAAEMRLSWPSSFHFIENYKKVFIEGNVLSSFINSTVITVASIAIIVGAASMTGYILQRRGGKIANVVSLIVLAGLIVPPSMITTFRIVKLLHLNGTHLGVILIEAAFNFSFAAILYRSFFKTVPREIDEAAIIDGANGSRLFFTIIYPLLKPVTVTVIIIQTITIWNDFTTPLYFLNSSTDSTLPLTIYWFVGRFSNQWNLVFADVILIALPVSLVYLVAQKYIVEGMTAGSIKA